ncbi:MAG: peptide-methionine (S)-S-oxide reductase MsrA [Candidatus Micrarchaeota archaeon]|nr:peptide-methionine (S)-S-oxide reductase MsrA [Candidatus Micrarchaeota archaeon]
MASNTEVIVLGGGCFWCTEAVFKLLKGVIKLDPGYAGGTTNNPKYWDVAGGATGHAEVIRVEYDPDIVPLEKLLEVFFSSHDPTTPNQDGANFGTEYRSLILYTSAQQKEAINKFIDKIRGDFAKPIVTEVKKLDKFYPAEEDHKDFYKKNPAQPYCIFVIRPKVDKIKKEFKL